MSVAPMVKILLPVAKKAGEQAWKWICRKIGKDYGELQRKKLLIARKKQKILHAELENVDTTEKRLSTDIKIERIAKWKKREAEAKRKLVKWSEK